MRDQGKKESSHDLSANITFWSCLGFIILLIFLSLSCSRTNCSPVLNAKQKHTKTLARTRRNLRVNYQYHQTKMGKLFNINIF